MDNRFIKLVIEEALSTIGLTDTVTVTIVGDRIWLKDSRRVPRDARWCYMDISNTTSILSLFNGRQRSKVDLSNPNGIAILGQAIRDGLTTTTLYLNEEE